MNTSWLLVTTSWFLVITSWLLVSTSWFLVISRTFLIFFFENVLTGFRKRQTHILKMQFHLKYRGRANGLICPSMLYCRMRFAMCSSQMCNNHFLSTFFAILHFMTSDLSMASQA